MHRSSQSAYFGVSSTTWTRAFACAVAPRKHLRILPTRTRPSLFGD